MINYFLLSNYKREDMDYKTSTQQYQHAYYLKTREARRKKVICDVCGRTISSEYLPKHRHKNICLNKKLKENNISE